MSYSIKDSKSFDCKTSIACKLEGNTRAAGPAQGGNPTVTGIDNPINVTFKITDTKLYVPVVTLSTENDKKLLEQLRTG